MKLWVIKVTQVQSQRYTFYSNFILSFSFQEAAKKSKKKSKITLRQERDNDFNDLAASSGGNYDYNDFEDDFI